MTDSNALKEIANLEVKFDKELVLRQRETVSNIEDINRDSIHIPKETITEGISVRQEIFKSFPGIAANEIISLKGENSSHDPLEGLCFDSTRRTDYLSWPDYFMGVACLSAKRSKDPNTQVGACIVNRDQKIVGIGYNGMPRGCSDDLLPWVKKSNNPLMTKYPYVCHAEMNAIMNKNASSVDGCIIYVTLFPCNECAKMIIQSGIKEVIYLHKKKKYSWENRAAVVMFDLAKVQYEQFQPGKQEIMISFKDFQVQ